MQPNRLGRSASVLKASGSNVRSAVRPARPELIRLAIFLRLAYDTTALQFLDWHGAQIHKPFAQFV